MANHYGPCPRPACPGVGYYSDDNVRCCWIQCSACLLRTVDCIGAEDARKAWSLGRVTPPVTPTPMPDLNLDELERLEQAATDGEWFPVYDSEDEEFQYPIGIAHAPEFDTDLGMVLTLPGCGGMEHRDDDCEAADIELVCALRNAAPALLATARNHERLLVAVGAVCTAPGVGAEDDALLALTRLWEELSGRPGKADAPLADPIAYALLMNPD